MMPSQRPRRPELSETDRYMASRRWLHVATGMSSLTGSGDNLLSHKFHICEYKTYYQGSGDILKVCRISMAFWSNFVGGRGALKLTLSKQPAAHCLPRQHYLSLSTTAAKYKQLALNARGDLFSQMMHTHTSTLSVQRPATYSSAAFEMTVSLASPTNRKRFFIVSQYEAMPRRSRV